MTALILIVALIVFLFAHKSKGKVDDANRAIKQERGDAYNAKAAGNGWRDGTCLVMFAVVLAIGLFMLAGSVFALLPK